jgi:hypothetical protein
MSARARAGVAAQSSSFYSRRKLIIDEIKRLIAGGGDATNVVESLEEQRLRSKASLS